MSTASNSRFSEETEQNELEQAVQAAQSSQPVQTPPLGGKKEGYGFARLVTRSLPQLILFNAAISLPTALLVLILSYISRALLSSAGTVLTSANVGQVLLSWQGLLLIVITTLIITSYVAIEIFAHVYFCEGLLTCEPGSLPTRAMRSIKQALKSLPRFRTLGGILIFIYIVLVSPLVGVGFSTGLTRDLYIPNFIMSVIEGTPSYFAAYIILILALVVLGLLHTFTIHYVLLDGKSPKQALRASRHLVCSHPGSLLLALLKLVLTAVLFTAVMIVLISTAVAAFELLSHGYAPSEEGALVYLMKDLEPTETSFVVSAHRSLCFFVNIIALGLATIGCLLLGSCTLMYVTHLYHWHSKGQAEKPRYLQLPKRMHRWAAALWLILAIAVVGAASLLCGFTFDLWAVQDTHVKVVAHRLGGDGAPENSAEGLEFAIEKGCYGAETDIQRTKDGHYIINHDADFSRLCGNDATPQDLTLKEAKALRIHDPLHPGTEVEVPTFEEVLDAAKGRIKLFVEFKGETADRQMVDDAVRIVKEHGAEDNVVFISLEYDCIEYGKKTYPEFDFGLLIFAGFGDMELLQCDIVLAEEEMTTDDFIDSAHEASKEVGVWTANTEEDLRKVLYGFADYVITDEVEFARTVQKDLDKRNDSEVIQDIVWR